MTAPTIISVVESTFDVSVFFDINEEENQENDSSKKLEVEFAESNMSTESLITSEERKSTNHYSESYSKFFLKLHSPPPEQV
jgi:transposase-like protein